MNPKLLFLMHTMLGLKLEPEELHRVLQATSMQEIEQALESEAARTYVDHHPEWWRRSEEWLQICERRGVRWCALGDDDYPLSWRSLSQHPIVFCYWGEPCWKSHSFLSVVGSRTPMTDTCLWMQRELGAFLHRQDVGIVSGGARGVDQWAHRLALDHRRPTICVLPTGILNPYPFGQEDLWTRILDGGGCLISTFSPSEPLRKWAFHVRNRWVIGLSPLCFVVEANRRSGTSLSGSLAQEEGRAICTLPVFPLAQQGLANLDLIASGATLIRDHQDLEMLWGTSSPSLFKAMSCEE